MIDIVIIDDNADDLFFIKRLLKPINKYSFNSFTNSKEALTFLKNNKQHCVLLDYTLPEINAIEFLELLKKNDLHIPVIILTGQGDEKKAVDSIKNGAMDYIPKNMLTTVFLDKSIENVLERYNLERNESNHKNFLKAFLDLLPDPIYVKNIDGIFIDCNIQYCNFLNLKKQEIIGKTIHNIVPDNLADYCSIRDKELFDNLGQQEYETQLITKNQDTPRYVLNKKIVYFNSENKPAGIIGVLHDITDIKIREKALIDMTEIDPLTKIYNRRYFDLKLLSEIKRNARSRQPISIILIDIDYFKKYNDTYGHVLGDECLIRVAQAIKTALSRSDDCVARYGGEEFVCILPNTNTNGALSVGNKIKNILADLKIEHINSDINPYVTLSQGIYTVEPVIKQENIQDIIAKADEALYKAKKNGRNKIELY